MNPFKMSPDNKTTVNQSHCRPEELIFGSDLDLTSTKADLQGRQHELGLWTEKEGNEDYSSETHSNHGEWFWVENNAHGAREYNRTDWTGPAFLSY